MKNGTKKLQIAWWLSGNEMNPNLSLHANEVLAFFGCYCSMQHNWENAQESKSAFSRFLVFSIVALPPRLEEQPWSLFLPATLSCCDQHPAGLSVSSILKPVSHLPHISLHLFCLWSVQLLLRWHHCFSPLCSVSFLLVCHTASTNAHLHMRLCTPKPTICREKNFFG